MFNPGFPGGTTESAWKRIVETYPDRVAATQERRFAFRLGEERVVARSVSYKLLQGADWEEAAWPKVLLRDDQFGLVQEAIAPWLTLFLREAPVSRRFAFDLPVQALDGSPAELRVEAAWEPSTGTLKSWWLSEHNLDTPRLRY
ncbi:MAG: hypothetical protein IPQ13_03495 [Holophagaceae bacterium]|nr:hypothetical protein [Holophagaceae bacterium]